MWFFDNVLEEAPVTDLVSSPVTKNADQDGSFLIIDDSVTVNNIPDTAVQLFDVTPAEVSSSEVGFVPETSFFSEPVSSVVENSETTPEPEISSSPEIAFFDESVADNIEATIVLEEKTETNNLVSFMEEPIVEASKETPEVSVMEEVIESVQQKNTSTLKKIDFSSYLTEKKAELEQFIANNMQIAEVKDTEIVTYNTQIAEAKEMEKQAIETAKKIAKRAIDAAKESAKQALEERKNIELENDRIKEIMGRLSIQA
ncbi:MAG: hypothetical protein ACD_78C00066G0002 [uncultured bacterium (gcode 4)]|uniref:Uncharacterized protein n=1 Tax=uncultured bacterium (gcode 4) TaxID=1234023 RepID=K1YDS1_9BACT|nr:MAG: hypothetical protein ACD_78C00066G0002 [uncultured bacterium (gcode 4)]